MSGLRLPNCPAIWVPLPNKLLEEDCRCELGATILLTSCVPDAEGDSVVGGTNWKLKMDWGFGLMARRTWRGGVVLGGDGMAGEYGSLRLLSMPLILFETSGSIFGSEERIE